jgi:hypothetical protein
MDIIKILQEMADNGDDKYNVFKERLIEYCTNNANAVFMVYRLLRGMERELGACLKGNKKVNVDRVIIIKVLKTIRVEIDIVRCRMEHPEVFEQEATKSVQPVGTWTSDKIDLIELLFAIKMSINNGSVSLKALQNCFEYVFKVKLGNIYDRFSEINERKEDKTRYLESLIVYLNTILDKLNE